MCILMFYFKVWSKFEDFFIFKINCITQVQASKAEVQNLPHNRY